MKPDTTTLGRFVLHVLLWLVPCFAIWYATSPVLARVSGWFAWVVLDVFQPGLIATTDFSGSELAFVTSLRIHALSGQLAVLAPEINARAYGVGLTLFLALMLGSRANWPKILLGALMLLPFQCWGITFDVLSQLLHTGPEVDAQLHWSNIQVQAISFGYMTGNLLFPTLIPVVLWAHFSRSLVARMTGVNVAGAARLPEEKWSPPADS